MMIQGFTMRLYTTFYTLNISFFFQIFTRIVFQVLLKWSLWRNLKKCNKINSFYLTDKLHRTNYVQIKSLGPRLMIPASKISSESDFTQIYYFYEKSF